MFGLLRRLGKPRTVRGASLPTMHIGTNYGGWVIPSHFLEPGSICYCAGAGEDISFDGYLAEHLGAEVWVIDPTPRAVSHFAKLTESVAAGIPFGPNGNAGEPYDISPEGLSRLHYLPVGLWKETGTMKFFSPKDESHVSHSIINLQSTDSGFEARTQRVSEVMRNLGHDHIDLLKLDIEGAEIVVLETMLDDGLDVRVVGVEYHEAAGSDSVSKANIDGSIRRMAKAGYVLSDLDNRLNALFVRLDVADRLAR